MPGIVGLITRMPREWAEPQLRRMVDITQHESFYVNGTWTDEALGVYVGWTARKGSFSDGMPLCNEQGDAVLIFSGEEFSEPGTASRLRQRGHAVNLCGPSYLVHEYEEDPTFPAQLNGRFHGLSADRTRETVMLFNDRYGMQRLYYHESEEAFYFAAEAKAILAVRPELRRADCRGLGELMELGCVLENRTVFHGIHVLPSASAWVFRNGSIERKSGYFQPREWEDQTPLEPEAYYQELRDVFSRNLPRYFNGQERVAVSLTGGVDTRMIMAWQRSAPGSLPCYTFGGTFHDSQDVVIARQIARVCGQPHDVIRAGQEFLDRFSRYAQRTVYLTDGCADVSRSPVLYVNEQAAKIAPIRMTGNYGGEVMRQLRPFKPDGLTPALFHPEFHSYINMAKRTYAGLRMGRPPSFAVFQQAPWHHYGLLALEQTQVSLRSPYLDNDFVRTVFRSPAPAFQRKDESLRLIADGNPDLLAIRTDRGHHAGGRHGLSARVVREFLEFTFKAEYAYNYGMPQWLARIDHVLAPFHLERLFLGRHKYYHFRVWYRDALADYVRDMLLDKRALSRPFVDRKTVEAFVRGHLRGDRNYTTEIHKLLTLELIHRLFLD